MKEQGYDKESRAQAMELFWEDRYDALQEEIYKIGWCWKNWRKETNKHPKKIIRDFIKQELVSQKQQILDIVEGMDEDSQRVVDGGWSAKGAYRQALSDIKSKVESL